MLGDGESIGKKLILVVPVPEAPSYNMTMEKGSEFVLGKKSSMPKRNQNNSRRGYAEFTGEDLTWEKGIG